MPFRDIIRKMRVMQDDKSTISRRGTVVKHMDCRGKSQAALELPSTTSSSSMMTQHCHWASMPSELLLDIIQRVEASETSCPARRVIIACATVCRSWREITKEVVKTPEKCGWLTFPISVKQLSLGG